MTQTISLTYAMRPPKWRRWRWRLAMSVMAAALAVPALCWGPWTLSRATLLYWQRECMTFEPPDGAVLSKAGPAKAKESADYAPVPSSGAIAFAPRCLRRLDSIAPVAWPNRMYSPWEATLFLHELQTPAGKRRLVHVTEGGGGTDLKELLFWVDWRVYEPATVRSPLKRLGPDGPGHIGTGSPIGFAQLYVGQSDPEDATHFVFWYSSEMGNGTIDGWLKEDDSIHLVVRDGPAKGQHE